jgi:hypothetical protein
MTARRFASLTAPAHTQQRRILVLLEDLLGRLDPTQGSIDPLQLTMKTQHLIRWVRVHHAFEHENLMAPAARLSTPAEQAALRRFAEGLHRMEDTLSAHESHWSEAAIAADPHGFATATHALAEMLRERIALEQMHLFALVDSVVERQARVQEYLHA